MEETQETKRKFAQKILSKTDLDKTSQADKLKSFKTFRLQSSDFVSSFVYRDNITNDKLLLNAQRVLDTCTGDLRHTINDTNQDSALNSLNNSSSLARQTRNFHLRSLRSRNYKITSKRSVNCLPQPFDVTLSESINRQKLTSYFQQKKQQKQNFQKQKKILSEILHRGSSLKQHNKSKIGTLRSQTLQRDQVLHESLQSICKNFQKNSSEQKLHGQVLQKRRQFQGVGKPSKNKTYLKFASPSKQNQKPHVDEKQIMEQINTELKTVLRKNLEYLIKPDLSKRLFNIKKKSKPSLLTQNLKNSKNLLAGGRVSFIHMKTLQQYQKMNPQLFEQKPSVPKAESEAYNIEQYKFRHTEYRLSNLVDRSQEHQASLPCSGRQLVQAIQQGNFFKAEIQLSLNPGLIHTKQPNTSNNLLHLCVLNNKLDIFEMVLRKCQHMRCDLLAQLNKYGRTPLDLGTIFPFAKSAKLAKLIATVEKERVNGYYSAKTGQPSQQGSANQIL